MVIVNDEIADYRCRNESCERKEIWKVVDVFMAD